MAAWGNRLFQPRVGVMVHYDASQNDRVAVTELQSPALKVSYQQLVLDNGSVVRFAPDTARAYHAGVCRPSDLRVPYTDANSAFYGLAIAATDGEVATEAQFYTIVRLTVGYFLKHGWGAEETYRITGHDREAWPRGRKIDPTGSRADHPVLSLDAVRSAVAATLTGSAR